MELNKIFQLKHELWLKILFSSFAIKNAEIKSELYEMAATEFRHMKWLSNKLKDENIEYDYEKYAIDIQKETSFQYFGYLINEIKLVMKEYNPDDKMFARMLSDEYYFMIRLNHLLSDENNNETITAFNRERIYKSKNLDCESTDAFTKFLFEETYKEYELIFVYAYMQNYTNCITQYNVYQDLIDESQYHLKCFGNMLGEMGILAIPRTVIKEIYKRQDIKKFLLDGIEEEKMAKEECIKLATAVKDEELSKFFEFINYQENYHIELMQKAIAVLNASE
jgi:rubrerythrin